MREHQIAISLKPQQFELLQQLARERGFKSVTAYVKQKIVELALGVESDEAAQGFAHEGKTGYKGNGDEYQTLLSDLSRIHSELKAFVGQAAPVSAPLQLPGPSDPFDLPPPGQINPGSLNSPSSSNLVSSPNPARSQSEASTALGIPSRRAEGEPVSAQVLPSTNLGGFGFRLGGFGGGGGGAQGRYQAPANKDDKLAGYREVMDDLEELADRAFAISPRLGALDEQAEPDAAIARGGRSTSESIFVEPILPKKPDKDVAKTNAQAKAAPINMVTPVSPANLPGPEQMQASSAALPKVAAAVQAELPLQALPPEPVSTTVSTSAPLTQPVMASDPNLQPEPAPSPAPAPSPTAPAAAASAPPPQSPPLPPPIPLPGDDLLSELLDESLVAHAEAPRPPGNPYAVNLGFVRPEQAENNSPSETEGSSEEVESPGNNIVSSETVPESILESTSNSVPEFLSETHSETLSESIAKVVPEAVAEAVSEPNASTLPAMIDEKEKEKEKEEEEKAPSNDKRSSASLDATASAPRPASPNISGGPPPRRRRT